MATFTPGKPVTTEKPAVTVDAGLKVGVHRFRLVVVDAGGNESKPDEVRVIVREQVIVGPVRPVPVPTPVPIPRPIPIPDPGPLRRSPT